MRIAEYVALLALVAASGAGIPTVGDAALIAAGTLAGEGRLNVWIVLAVSMAGWMLGSLAGYQVGARRGRNLLDRPGRLENSRRTVLAKGEEAFGRHTFAASVKMKSYLSGIFRVGLRQFALGAAISGTTRIGAYVGLAYFAGAEVAESIGNAGGGLALGVLVVVAAGLAIKAAYSTWQARDHRPAGPGGSPAHDETRHGDQPDDDDRALSGPDRRWDRLRVAGHADPGTPPPDVQRASPGRSGR